MLPIAQRSGRLARRVAVDAKRTYADLVLRESTGQGFVAHGPGGRSSVSGNVVTVFGCTGFVGRYLVNRLGQQGMQVVTAYRGDEYDQRHLRIMGDLGQIVPTRFDLRNDDQIVECLRNSDTVFNLIGRDFATKSFTFHDTHIAGAQKIAKLAKENGVTKFIHVSALNARPDSKSLFLRSKALGEQAVLAEFPDATIVRPATIYGAEDKFFNRWCAFMVFFYSIPLINGGMTKVRPVYVGDVANALASMVKSDAATGKLVELFGPTEFTLRQILDVIVEISHRGPLMYPLPKPLAKLVGRVLDTISMNPLITADEVERMYVDEVPSGGAVSFAELGIKPQAIADQIIRFTRMYRSSEATDEGWMDIAAKLRV
ncbi:hypothetical protein DFJ74DRAFT_686995 [Hyaloraphidium curvatum]|nr:hypothetical protein DFJ74DRAFT_686995 [Hyaloraphidium curvatum]